MNKFFSSFALNIIFIYFTALTKYNVAVNQPICHCGRKPSGGIELPTARIMNGKLTASGEFPWIVGIRNGPKQRFFCGGSLVSDRHVLTSAYCVTKMIPGKSEVVVNEHTQFEKDRNTTVIQIAHVFYHCNYNETGNNEYDVAVVYLRKPVQFSDETYNICLPYDLYLEEACGQSAAAAGWGEYNDNDNLRDNFISKKNETSKGSNSLRKTSDMTLIDWQRCQEYWPPGKVNSWNICTEVERSDTCQGDSGGPLMYYNEDKQRYYQVGIISYGELCNNRNGTPHIYTSMFDSSISCFLRFYLRSGEKCGSMAP